MNDLKNFLVTDENCTRCLTRISVINKSEQRQGGSTRVESSFI